MEQVVTEDVPDKLSHFEDACERLTEAAMECVLNLADEHENLSEIVTMLIPYKNVDNIKKTVLKLLTVTSKSKPIWTMKAALDLLKSTNMEDDNAEDILNLEVHTVLRRLFLILILLLSLIWFQIQSLI